MRSGNDHFASNPIMFSTELIASKFVPSAMKNGKISGPTDAVVKGASVWIVAILSLAALIIGIVFLAKNKSCNTPDPECKGAEDRRKAGVALTVVGSVFFLPTAMAILASILYVYAVSTASPY